MLKQPLLWLYLACIACVFGQANAELVPIECFSSHIGFNLVRSRKPGVSKKSELEKRQTKSNMAASDRNHRITLKAGSHCDIGISISINISIRIVSVNRRNININISIRKWKIFHFLMQLCLICCYVAVCEAVVHKHKQKHKYVCSFPVTGKTRKRSAVPL